MGFADRFLQSVLSNALICSGNTLIVAVSGGADSMALLHTLVLARRSLGLTLIVAHYDHHLRSSSNKDLVFVDKAARRLGLEFVSEVNQRAVPDKGSVEEFAREQRYDFLRRVAKKYSADALVTAHTRDDLAETVLMRLMRGTGLAGLQAILPDRMMGGVRLIRPMLAFSRQEVEDFLREIRVRFVNDPTNRSMDFTRNKVRRQLIPYLEKEFQSGVKDNLARLADTAANDYAFIEGQAAGLLLKHLKAVPKGVSFPLNVLKRQHIALRRAILREMDARLHKDVNTLTLAHIDLIEKGLFAERGPNPMARLSLPGGGICVISGAVLVFKSA